MQSTSRETLDWIHLKLFKDDTTFRDVCGTCGFFGDARGHQCSFLLCLHPQGCLRRGVRASCSPQVRTGKLGSFSMLHHPRGYVSNFLVRPASSWGTQESPGTLSKQSRGIDPHAFSKEQKTKVIGYWKFKTFGSLEYNLMWKCVCGFYCSRKQTFST